MDFVTKLRQRVARAWLTPHFSNANVVDPHLGRNSSGETVDTGSGSCAGSKWNNIGKGA